MYVSVLLCVILSKITCMFIACLSCIFVILLNKFNSIQFIGPNYCSGNASFQQSDLADVRYWVLLHLCPRLDNVVDISLKKTTTFKFDLDLPVAVF